MTVYRILEIRAEQDGFFRVFISGPLGRTIEYLQWGPERDLAVGKAEAVVEKQNHPEGIRALTIRT